MSEITDKIASDMLKTGFVSEMKAAQIMLERGWSCQVSPTYEDLDSGLTREYDLRASRMKTGSSRIDNTLYVALDLCIEIKKTKTPWVVLKTSESSAASTRLLPEYGHLHTYENLSVQDVEFSGRYFGDAPWNRLGWYGYGIHDAFKAQDANSVSYAALVTASKAAFESWNWTTDEFFPDWAKRHQYVSSHEAVPRMFIAKPVVVVDNDLFSAELRTDGALDVKQISWANIHFRFGTPRYTQKSFAVHVVTLAALSEYCAHMEEFEASLFKRLCSDFRASRRKK